MKVYCGSVGGSKALTLMSDKNYGIMVTPVSWKNADRQCVPWRYWALDNGAYKAYTDGKDFDENTFLKTVFEKVPRSELLPDFIVTPDIVGAGLESLQFSLDWRSRLKSLSQYNWYLAVQDGMRYEDINLVLDLFDGIFVGGTNKWKVKTGEGWVKLAHRNNIPCHFGRIGTYKRIVWAMRVNADSIDSTAFFSWKSSDAYERLDSARLQTLLEV